MSKYRPIIQGKGKNKKIVLAENINFTLKQIPNPVFGDQENEYGEKHPLMWELKIHKGESLLYKKQFKTKVAAMIQFKKLSIQYKAKIRKGEI